MTTARERLAGAALTLFEDRGYDDTTVDDIAERAGVGRSTFFRHHRSKEDAVFPDHEDLLRRTTSLVHAVLRVGSHALVRASASSVSDLRLAAASA